MMDHSLLVALFGEEFAAIWNKISEYTMVSPERAYATYQACHYVSTNRIEGDFVECGVYRGGMGILAALTFAKFQQPRRIWLFDTYSGMVEPTDIDEDRTGLPAAQALAEDPTMCLATLDEVKRNIRLSGFSEDQFRFVQGDVSQTLNDRNNIPNAISVLRLDTDWYESTKIELETLYPVVNKFGIVLVDDYGHWVGARKAVDDFVDAAATPLFVARTDSTGVSFVKTDSHRSDRRFWRWRN